MDDLLLPVTRAEAMAMVAWLNERRDDQKDRSTRTEATVRRNIRRKLALLLADDQAGAA